MKTIKANDDNDLKYGNGEFYTHDTTPQKITTGVDPDVTMERKEESTSIKGGKLEYFTE